MDRFPRELWRHGAAAAAACLVAWFPFVRDVRVPLLGLFDLGMHELGHMLAGFMPVMVMFLAGSFTQIAVPAGLAIYFWMRRDRASSAFTMAWAGASAWDVSVYIADAPFERLPLIGGQHDWAYLLGPQGWNAMGSAGTIAGAVEFVGVIAAVAGIGVGLLGVYQALRVAAERPIRAPRAPMRAARIPGDPYE